jgi:hypothetical protein
MASIIRVTRIGELGTTLAGNSNRSTPRRNTQDSINTSEDGILLLTISFSVRFQVFTAVIVKNAVFCDVASCGSCQSRGFGGIYRLHLQSRKRSSTSQDGILKAHIVFTIIYIVKVPKFIAYERGHNIPYGRLHALVRNLAKDTLTGTGRAFPELLSICVPSSTEKWEGNLVCFDLSRDLLAGI